MGILVTLLAVFIVVVAYLLPSLVASRRKHLSANSVFVVNLFLGWTFIAWVLCLAWSLNSNVPQPSPATATDNNSKPSIAHSIASYIALAMCCIIATLLTYMAVAKAEDLYCEDIAQAQYRAECNAFWDVEGRWKVALTRKQNTCRYIRSQAKINDTLRIKSTEGYWTPEDCDRDWRACVNRISVYSKKWGNYSDAWMMHDQAWPFFALKYFNQEYIGLNCERSDLLNIKFSSKHKKTAKVMLEMGVSFGNTHLCHIKYVGTMTRK